jgi:prepilin-type N-terminal cleavage/methylation domain-containing protein
MKLNTQYAIRGPRPASSGFTLVELMAVIVIIGVVSGIVVAGASYANRLAMKNRSVATVQQVCTACEMFFSDKSQYPPDITCYVDSGTQSSLRSRQFVWPCESLWFWLEYNNPHMQKQYERAPYIVFKREQLTTGNTKINAAHDESPGNYMRIVDAWGNPLNYKSYNGNSYKFTDGTMMPRHNNKTTDTIWGQPAYDLCSYGADGTTWQERDKPFDRQQDLKLDQMATVEHWNGEDSAQIPVYFVKPFENQVSGGGGTKHCYGGEDNDDINNWQQR